MAVICPTVTAYDVQAFQAQLRQVSFAKRIHLDFMDGEFTPEKSPGLTEVMLPPHQLVDVHLMYQKPMELLADLVKLHPHMVVVHNEAEVHHMHFAAELHKHDIKTGLALLHDTPVEWAEQIMHSFDQILIFSGHLGYQGGEADLTLLDKVKFVKHHHPEAEIAWDGGINDQNAKQLAEAGVDVLNVGGFIQKADNPKANYEQLQQALS
ncbi:MAG TPA: hypothetical protein VLF87_01620 [Patescibacteria group bacterium]|nr:hypothetical protein [Patescibacteria group bacterium]